MPQRKKPKKAATPPDDSPTPAEVAAAAKLYGKRVRLAKVNEAEGNPHEEEELLNRIGRVGTAKSPFTDHRPSTSVLVLFDDGRHFCCVPEELELCANQGTLSKAPPGATCEPRYVQS